MSEPASGLFRQLKHNTDNPIVVVGARKIVTSPIFPPINVRGLDWAATFDGYEPGCPIGHGATEQEAIDDLLEQEASK